ncbi:MAG: queuosine precursor transporter [Gammaproteobacteria bacterium]
MPSKITISNSIENVRGYQFLALISMLYVSIIVASSVLTNRYVGTDKLFILGGALTIPLMFILDDIIAEVFGYKITQFIILACFISLTFFTILCQIILILPHPLFFKYQQAYNYILGPNLVRIDVSNMIAYISANLINSYILTRWKIILKGKKFWLRSVGSSAISEILYTFIATILMEFNAIPLSAILKAASISLLIKAIFSISLAYPAHVLVANIKRYTGIDVYDFPKGYTPSKFFGEQENSI